MAETAREQIEREINDPDEPNVGPYAKHGDNAFAIETIAWAAGLTINDEGYAVPSEE